MFNQFGTHCMGLGLGADLWPNRLVYCFNWSRLTEFIQSFQSPSPHWTIIFHSQWPMLWPSVVLFSSQAPNWLDILAYLGMIWAHNLQLHSRMLYRWATLPTPWVQVSMNSNLPFCSGSKVDLYVQIQAYWSVFMHQSEFVIHITNPQLGWTGGSI